MKKVKKLVTLDGEENGMAKSLMGLGYTTSFAGLVRSLIREEYARKFSQPNAAITVQEAIDAGSKNDESEAA